MALLEVENLVVEFQTSTGAFRAVDGVSLKVHSGEVLASSANPAPANPCRCSPPWAFCPGRRM